MIKNEKGSVFIYVLIAALALGASAYYFMEVVKKNQTGSKTQRIQFELDLLAQDLKEYGKYLMFYEKMFYVDKALYFDKDLRANWKNSLGIGNEACGYKGLSLGYEGTNKVGDQFVFCPIYLRNNLLASEMLDESIFIPWKKQGLLTYEDGIYTLTLKLGDLSATNNNFTKFHVDDNGVLSDFPGVSDAKIVIDFFSTATGVNLKNSDRMFRITSEVYLKTGLLSRKIRSVATETFLLKPSTPRGFSLFMIYPVKHDSPSQDANDFLEAADLNQNDKIFGKTFINSDFTYTDASKLPIFYDTVIIGKQFKELVPTDANIAQMKNNFRNGIVANFSVERFLLDDPGVINNASSLLIPAAIPPNKGNSVGIKNYIQKLGSDPICLGKDIISGAVNVEYYPPYYSCEPYPINEGYISGGSYKIEVKGAYSFIQSPVRELFLNGSSSVNIYGIVAGGAIRKSSNLRANFYSLQTLRVGLPGIAEASSGGDVIAKTELDVKNATATEGVTVPLLNIPNIYSADMGFR